MPVLFAIFAHEVAALLLVMTVIYGSLSLQRPVEKKETGSFGMIRVKMSSVVWSR